MPSYEHWRALWHKRMPILHWLPRYDIRRDLKHDVIAGFTVGVMLVPQEMSLAAMMGVPGQYGLYTAAIAPLIYPLFGSSRALSVANASEGSLLVGVMLRAADIRNLDERIATGILLTFFTGLLMILAGLLHQGGLVSFFSRTSMHGYVTATAFLIVTSQVPPWLGISLSSPKLTVFTWLEILMKVSETNTNSLLLGLVSLVVLYICKRLRAQLQHIGDAHKRASGESAKKKSSMTGSNSSDLISEQDTDGDEEEQGGDGEDAVDADRELDDVIEVQLHDSADVRTSTSKNKRSGRVTSSSFLSSTSQKMSKVHLVQTQTSSNDDDTTRSKLIAPPASASKGLLANLLLDRPRTLFLAKLLCDAGALLVCVFGILVGASLGEEKLRLTGAVHQGFPAPVFPPSALGVAIPWNQLQTVVTNAVVIAVIFFMSSVATGSKLATKDGYEISPNQELLGLGFANLGASLFQGMPSSAGMSRSAINSQSAHTPLASMLTAVLVILTILFLTGPLYYLPQAPLSAIIVLSALSLIDFSEPKWLRRVRRHEFYVWVGAFAGTLCFGLLNGIGISLLVSLVEIMVRTKKPPVFVLGQLPDGSFAKLRECNETSQSSSSAFHPDGDNALKPEELLDVLILRMEQDLYFGNARHLIHAIERDMQVLKERGRILGAVLDGARMNDIDATAIHLLKEFQLKLRARDQVLLFANLRRETELSILDSGLAVAQKKGQEGSMAGTNSSVAHRPSDRIASAVAHLRQ